MLIASVGTGLFIRSLRGLCRQFNAFSRLITIKVKALN